MPAPSRTADQFVVRMPEGMRERLKERARQNNRSTNAEIVSQLERAMTMDTTGKSLAALAAVHGSRAFGLEVQMRPEFGGVLIVTAPDDAAAAQA